MTTNTDTDHAADTARAALDSIRAMVVRLKHAQDSENDDTCDIDDDTINAGLNIMSGTAVDDDARAEYHDEEAARLAIEEDALSIEVRSGWHTPGASPDDYDHEYSITLFTGGPAGRIVGDLNQWSEPTSARLEYQDWFRPWESLPISTEEESALITYASVFYFAS